MPTYIKTGFWDEKAKAPKEWLDLNWFCATHGGGGGSQDIDQVLAVGNTATNKSIQLNGYGAGLSGTGTAGTEISSISLTPTLLQREYINNGIGVQKNNFFISQFDVAARRNTLQTVNGVPVLPNTESELFYESDANGKNQFFIRKLNGSLNNNRRFEVNASYSGGNTVEIVDENTSADTFASVKMLAENQTTYVLIKSTPLLSLNVFDQLQLTPNNFIFVNTSGSAIQVNPTFPAIGTIVVDFPEYSGLMANVNERIFDNNVDLSVGNYPCAVYGVYVVNVGDNTNTFDLDTFVSNGVDGQFVTICVQDTPVKCTNTAGNFWGAANINSVGLFKLMKVGNDIYSSNI